MWLCKAACKALGKARVYSSTNVGQTSPFFASTIKVSDRNNMWLMVGKEDNDTGTVLWSQPELALYERDHSRGHGYPDIITDGDGKVYITETYVIRRIVC